MLILKEGREQFVIEGYSRSELLDMLGDQTVVISFKKVSNNRDRVMYGTRDLSKIPSRHHPSGAGLPYNDPNVIPIYDLMKKAWRSFRVNRVSKAEPQKIGFLTRLLRRRKYTKDHDAGKYTESYEGKVTYIEAVQIPRRRKSFKEMAAGAVGGGSVSDTSPEVFRARTVKILRGIEARLSSGKLVMHGKVGPATLYSFNKGGMGLAFLTLSQEKGVKAMEDPDSVVFTCELHEVYPDSPEINSMDTYTIESPYVDPAHAGKGLASQVYGLFGREYNIMADNVQSRQGRALWYKMVRSKTFPYVYVYDMDMEEVQEEISGDGERFKELMQEGDDSVRFIGTFQRARS